MTEPLQHGMLRFTPSGPPDAPPVVLLHGWGSNAAVMETVAAAIAGRFRVYNVDLPGHGGAPLPPRALDLADHASEVRSLIRDVVKGPAALVGHSNGGRIGLYLAAEADAEAYLSRLVLISPSGIARRAGAGLRLRRVIAVTLKAPFMALPRPAREFGLDWLRHSLAWRLLSSEDYRALEGVMRETFVRLVGHTVEDRLDRIAVPVLLFWGDRDREVVREQIDRLVAGLRDVRLEVLEGAGHFGFIDRGDRFVPALRAFLCVA